MLYFSSCFANIVDSCFTHLIASHHIILISTRLGFISCNFPFLYFQWLCNILG
ncbi:hypothetical protein MtrunA17_Chr1g0157821 [Medicago truncatula]|uniref:Uncharacterized protein n=1 Tax=Medicago truncatula TaxID=3880 RepID=A0A396JK43_MEDTR|nr:hypothetical protein MtrunA17_Chr1g0157821 [Medicago truncatula]